MFVLSVKSSKTKLAVLIAAVAVLAGCMLFMTFRGESEAVRDSSVNYRADSAQQRIAFLSQFGWNVKEDPVEVEEVLIPESFDEVYEKYNQIQKEQNLDLSLYKGMRVKRWSYEILNYPGYTAESGCVRINLLVYNGQVIGGDVCSIELGGFMHGFDRPSDKVTNKEENVNGTSAAR